MRFKKKESPTESIRQFQERVSVELLSSFEQFQAWPLDALVLIGEMMELQRMRPGSILFELGANDEVDYFLIDGQVDLVASDGRRTEIVSNTDRAQQVISRLRPRKYKAEVVRPSVLLTINRNVLSDLVKRAERLDDMKLLDVNDPHLAKHGFYLNFTADLSSGKVTSAIPADIHVPLQNAMNHAQQKVAANLAAQDLFISSRAAFLIDRLGLTRDDQGVGGDIKDWKESVLTQLVEHQQVYHFKQSTCEALWRKRHNHALLTGAMIKLLAERAGLANSDELRNAATQTFLGELMLITYADRSTEKLTEAELSQKVRSCAGFANKLLAQEWALPALTRQLLQTQADAGPDEPTTLFKLAQMHIEILDSDEAPKIWTEDPAFRACKDALELNPNLSMELVDQARGIVDLRSRPMASA